MLRNTSFFSDEIRSETASSFSLPKKLTLKVEVQNLPKSSDIVETFQRSLFCYTHVRTCLISFRKCGPRLSDAAAEKLKHRYVLMRSGVRTQDGGKPPAIPITVRQLEAVVRISESLAKMQLQPFAGLHHVDEALRLFQVSTLDAAASGSLSGLFVMVARSSFRFRPGRFIFRNGRRRHSSCQPVFSRNLNKKSS